MTSFIIKKNSDDYAEQNTDIYERLYDNYTLDADAKLNDILDGVVWDINFCSRAEWGTSIDDNETYGYGYEDLDEIDKITDRCVNKAVEKLKTADCEALIIEVGLYKSLEISRDWSCDYRQLRMEKDWRRVVYALIRAGIGITDWITEISFEEYKEIVDGDPDDGDADDDDEKN
jgi:hypothetical protein